MPAISLVQNTGIRAIDPSATGDLRRISTEPSTNRPGPNRASDTVAVSPEAEEANRAAAGRRTPVAAEPGDEQGASGTGANANPRGADGEPLSDEEAEQVDELKRRDAEVRQHEQAHVAAGGPYVTSGPTYEYQQGPDGRRYAVGGSVGIDTSPEDTPEATITKAQTIRRAALAPAEPSSQDRRVAAQASQMEQEARAELASERREALKANGSSGDAGTTALAEQETPSLDAPGESIQQLDQLYATPKPDPTFRAVA